MNEQLFWERVIRHGLPWFRHLKRPISVSQLDRTLGDMPEWQQLKGSLKPGDQIWPFRLPRSKRVWGHREGFVALRDGRFVGGLVTTVS